MLFFTIINYKILKASKDSLIVPSIGAEAVNFIKFYLVVPSAVLFTMIYVKLANIFRFGQIYVGLGIFFMLYFAIFALGCYPYQETLHPSSQLISELLSQEVDLIGFRLAISHFKWFILIYSKWTYAIFYIVAELWGSTMIFLMFWQFSNQIVSLNQAKRLYPMINLLGSAGTFAAGSILSLITDLSFHIPVKELFTLMIANTAIILLLFLYVRKSVLVDEHAIVAIKASNIKTKLSFIDSMKLIFRSRYLGYVVILVICYGMSINLLEGPWKAIIKAQYPTPSGYLRFMGTVHQFNGLLAILFSIIGTAVLRQFNWFVAALVTPIVIFIMGLFFYCAMLLNNSASTFVSLLIHSDWLLITVVLGAIVNIFAQSSKFGLFDPTKEMAYIPLVPELRSKGKAVVDVIGYKFAKSITAFMQSLIFMLFPLATYNSLTPILMLIFVAVSIIWIADIWLLNKEYVVISHKMEDEKSKV